MRMLPAQPRAVVTPGAGGRIAPIRSRWLLLALPQPGAEEELNLFHQYVGRGRGPGGSSSPSAPCTVHVPLPSLALVWPTLPRHQ